MEKPNPKLTVVKEGDKFIIRDEEGANYGTYDEAHKANDARTDWELYYNAPLVF